MKKFVTVLCSICIVMCTSYLYAANENSKENVTTDSGTEIQNEMDQKIEWPDKIGPFILESKDKAHSLQFGLAVQVLFRVDNKDMGSGKDRDTITYAEARRIRPSLKGSIYNGMLNFYLQLNTSPNTLDLLDFYVNYKIHPYAQVRIGQWKIPFTRYRIQSYKRLTLVDWAITSKYFGAERQIGLAIHSGLEKPQKIDYAFGIYSGMNARSSHAVGIASLYGEKIISSSNLAESGPKMEFHPELVARIGYDFNNTNLSQDTDFEGGRFRCHLGLSATYDFNPDQSLDFTARLAPEILMKTHGWSFFITGYMGWADQAMSDNNAELAMLGGLVQTSYLFLKRYEVALRYSVVHNMEDSRLDARSRSDALIDAETNASIISELTAQYKNVGSVIREHELSFGVNIYIIGDSLKWQNDISYLLHELTGEDKEDVRFRSQLQLAF